MPKLSNQIHNKRNGKISLKKSQQFQFHETLLKAKKTNPLHEINFFNRCLNQGKKIYMTMTPNKSEQKDKIKGI